MQFLDLAIRVLASTILAHARAWHYLPLAFWMSLRSGGLFRWLWRTVTGFRWLAKELPAYSNSIPGDKIHFLRTGPSDAILLESQGRFALVDAAEDSAYPAAKPNLAYPGWEDYVVDYVKRVAGGKLDFVLGTHAHSDHIGGFDTLILDPDISIGRAYLKRYENEKKQAYEREYWDNHECYTKMVDALAVRKIPLIQGFPVEPFSLGNFGLTIFNGETRDKTGDENDSSLGLLVECDEKKAFLAGDINNVSGNENRLRREIGPVDLLKAGHHGYDGSSTLAFVTGLRPKTVIFCNHARRVYPTVLSRFMAVAHSKNLLATGRFGGVAAVFHGGELSYYSIGEYAEAQAPLPY